MFDSLRDQINDDASYNADSAYSRETTFDASPAPVARRGLFRGMTAVQRLILAVLLFLSVCVLGSMCLMITGAIRVP